MVFTSPEWVPELPIDPPDSITVAEFMASEHYGRRAFATSRNPYTCGLTGRTFSATESTERSTRLARALARRLAVVPGRGSEWDKVVAVFAFNSVDYVPLAHAVHRLGGVVTPISAAASPAELAQQLAAVRVRALVTCASLLPTALAAAHAAAIPPHCIFLLELPGDADVEASCGLATVSVLVLEGATLSPLPPLAWSRGQGARQTAFLCYSSGTSGLPKAVMVSHRNVIANVLQFVTFDSVARRQLAVDTQVALGLLPFSHIYGLVVVAHASAFRGDEVVVLPRFELDTFLAAIQRFSIQFLPLVPPIVVRMLRNHARCSKADLSCVRYLYTGAAPLGVDTVRAVLMLYPNWHVGQGYGMTETSTCVCSTSEVDIFPGSSGSLLPGVRAKLMATDGTEVTAHDIPGELLVQSPSVARGYLHNEPASAETFVWDADGRWICTGDKAVVRRAPSGADHVFIVDRIKELIKVNGRQVAPAELEALLLSHAAVDDCAVIPVPDADAGEVPCAYVVRAATTTADDDLPLARDLCRFVEARTQRYKWLRGGVVFVDAIPRNPSGKILRRLLRNHAEQEGMAKGAKL